MIFKYKCFCFDGFIIDEKKRILLDFGVELILVEKFNSLSEGLGGIIGVL